MLAANKIITFTVIYLIFTFLEQKKNQTNNKKDQMIKKTKQKEKNPNDLLFLLAL